jgi:hypothetical protein
VNRVITNKKYIIIFAQRQEKLIKILKIEFASTHARSLEGSGETQRQATIRKTFLAEISYFKCGQKDYLKKDCPERKF